MTYYKKLPDNQIQRKETTKLNEKWRNSTYHPKFLFEIKQPFFKAHFGNFLYLMKTCNWFNKWYLWNINLVFIHETLYKWHNSYLAVFPLIEFLLPGQKFISTLLSDILTILDHGRAQYFWIVFTIKLKRNNLRHDLKKYVKTSFNIPLD